MALTVYVDGACSGNGMDGARGGIGVWWGSEDYRNVSRPVSYPRQTNNTAEIEAATVAIQQAVTQGFNQLQICTDSQFLCLCVEQYIPKWLQNGWRTAQNKPVANEEELKVLIRWKNRIPGGVEFHHVGREYNTNADKLAKDGINVVMTPDQLQEINNDLKNS